MAIKTLRVTPWPSVDSASSQDPFRDAWTFGHLSEAAALKMQEALLHLSVNAYPHAGREASDPCSGACRPTKFLAQRDREMHLGMGVFSTFCGGPRLQTSPKLASVPSCEDYWSDASLSMPDFESPNEQIEGIEFSKASKGAEAESSFTPQLSDEELASSFEEILDDVSPDADDDTDSSLFAHIDEELQEEEQSMINIRYDIFPPPIVSPTRCKAYSHLPCGMQRVHLRSIKKDGRLILQELPVSAPHQYLRAERGNGRLRLQLIETEPFQAQASPADELEDEQHEEKAQEEEDEDKDEGPGVEEEDKYQASPATLEFELDDYNEYGNGNAAKANSIQQLKPLSSNSAASWVTPRGFLHESLNRIRPLVY